MFSDNNRNETNENSFLFDTNPLYNSLFIVGIDLYNFKNTFILDTFYNIDLSHISHITHIIGIIPIPNIIHNSYNLFSLYIISII